MPSPRSSPALRPTTPLSPRFESPVRHDGMMLPPAARGGLHPRSANTAPRRPGAPKLHSLPRFHPAVFASQHSSTANTPATGPNSPQPPVSPRAQQRMYSEAQKQLYLYQRETLALHRGSMPPPRDNPTTPSLVPLGSPGPVTPLELEGADGYLTAGARASREVDGTHSDELVEKLIQEEARRSHHSPTSSTSS